MILSRTLTPKIMKLPESTKSKITKDENGENMANSEIMKVALVHCKITNKIQGFCIHLFVLNRSVNY